MSKSPQLDVETESVMKQVAIFAKRSSEKYFRIFHPPHL